MAPVDRGPQLAMAPRPGPAAVGQQGQLVVQPVQNAGQREGAHPARRQFDGQRQPVQPSADLGHRTGLAGPELECRVARPGARQEQPDCLGPQQRSGVVLLAGGRQRQLADAEDDLARDPQRLPAGGEKPQPGASREQRRGQPCAGFGQVLAIVQHDQRRACAQRMDQCLDPGPASALPYPEGGGKSLRQQLTGLQRVEGHPLCAARPATAHTARELQCQTCLAHSAGAGQGQQPGGSQQRT
nr:hypothetical protein [Streptomyces lydicus]